MGCMVKINETYAESSAQNFNQMIRWVNTKEEHACKIITLISEYCLCQRVKKDIFPSDVEYVQALKSHHAVMQAAMRAKQNVSLTFADALDHSISDMSPMYLK